MTALMEYFIDANTNKFKKHAYISFAIVSGLLLALLFYISVKKRDFKEDKINIKSMRRGYGRMQQQHCLACGKTTFLPLPDIA